MTSERTTPACIGVDVGGTSIKAARTGPAGWRRAFAATTVRPTPVDGGADAVVAAVAATVRELVTADVAAAGVVVPGAVQDGVVRYAANLPLRELDLRGRLEAELGLPVVVGHDVAAAAEAEAAAADAADLLFVALGTGVAAADVRAGRAHRGATGQAGELGHLVVVADGEPCVCGSRGCLEVYASAAAIARRYREQSGSMDADARFVAARLEVEDEVAATVWRDAVDALAAGLAAGVLLLDPAVIVIGGGLSGAGDVLLEPVRKALAQRLTWRASPPVRIGVLGASAGQHGAARLALHHADPKERSA